MSLQIFFCFFHFHFECSDRQLLCLAEAFRLRLVRMVVRFWHWQVRHDLREKIGCCELRTCGIRPRLSESDTEV